MAASHYAIATSSLNHSCNCFTPRKPISLISCISTQFPSKPTRRKNHLRQKFLKTLTKSVIPKLPLENPLIPIESQPSQELKEPEIVEEVQESGELKGVEIEAPLNVDIVSKDEILKYGIFLVGAFVFQTLFAIWVFGGGGDKNEVLNVYESKNSVFLNENGSDVGTSDLEMEMKVEEIRVMARKVREKERLESKKSGFDGDDLTDEGRYLKSGINEEVDSRLIKVRTKLESDRRKMPVLLKKGELDDGGLLIKKKFKFKGLPRDPVEKPKGFIGLVDGDKIDKSKVSGNELIKEGEKMEKSLDVDPSVSDVVHVVEVDQGKRMEDTKNKVSRERGAKNQGNGVGKSKGIERVENNGRAVVEAAKSSKQNGDSLKGKGIEDGIWWLNLPYVLAILMRRGDDGERGEGLYTLKSISSTNDLISHTVAFEDRADATNFCYLLQSFFENLEDFNADVIPLPIEELKEAVKTRKVIVVRKGQLRLYAGQPLSDAEMALRAIIGRG